MLIIWITWIMYHVKMFTHQYKANGVSEILAYIVISNCCSRIFLSILLTKGLAVLSRHVLQRTDTMTTLILNYIHSFQETRTTVMAQTRKFIRQRNFNCKILFGRNCLSLLIYHVLMSFKMEIWNKVHILRKKSYAHRVYNAARSRR